MKGRTTRKWGGLRVSNPRPPEPQSGVLPLNYAHHTEARTISLALTAVRTSIRCRRALYWQLAMYPPGSGEMGFESRNFQIADRRPERRDRTLEPTIRP